MDKIIQTIANEFNIKYSQVENTVKLIDEGNTIPFIARYRKEVTGNLSDETLRDLDERLTYLRNLEKRKEEVIKSIDEQGKLTEELLVAISGAFIMGLGYSIMYKEGYKTGAIYILEDMYKILIEDEQIKKYFDLEVKFNVMIVDVNKIIAEAIKGVL